MAKISNATIQGWRELVEHDLKNYDYTPDLVNRASDAWTIASRVGILREAYNDRSMTDGHIQTALEKIFPNVVFKDKKTY